MTEDNDQIEDDDFILGDINSIMSPEDFELPRYVTEPIFRLSDEVREALGEEHPEIDLFETARPIIGIPRRYISNIIREYNAMKLIAVPFSSPRNMARAFRHSLRALGLTPEETADCFTGIFVGKDVKINACNLKDFSECVAMLPEHLDAVWGFYIVDDFAPKFGQVITVVTQRCEEK